MLTPVAWPYVRTFFRIIFHTLGIVRLSGNSGDMHTEEIQQLKDKLLPQEELLRQQEDIFRREESRESNKKEQVEKLARDWVAAAVLGF